MQELTERRDRLARDLDRWTAGQGDCATRIPNLTLFRREAPTAPTLCLVEPSVVLVVQGAKHLFVGGESYRYDAAKFLVTSLELPAYSEVVEARLDEPCLGLTLKLDLRLLAEVIAQGELPPPRDKAPHRSVALGTVTPALLDPFHRLVGLLDDPAALPVLAPLIGRELHYRLLTSDQAARLWHIASVGSQGHQIARAVDWLRVNYALPVRIDELATRAQMGPSTFHHHFRQLTAMSPLQYQKWLRLSEARRLMLNEGMEAEAAAFRVGYQSPSQFSREYSRLFGAPPKRNVEQLRQVTTRGSASVWGRA